MRDNSHYRLGCILEEVAPKVAEVTGWNVDIGNAMIVEGDYNYNSKDIRRKFAGEYDLWGDKIIAYPKNISEKQHLDMIKLAVAHELVHREQVIFSKNFRNLHEDLEYANDELGDIQYNPVRYLEEGDAVFVTGQIQKIWYPEVIRKNSWKELFERSDWKKPYRGIKVVREIYGREGRGGVNKLYDMNVRQLRDVFGKVMPRKGIVRRWQEIDFQSAVRNMGHILGR